MAEEQLTTKNISIGECYDTISHFKEQSGPIQQNQHMEMVKMLAEDQDYISVAKIALQMVKKIYVSVQIAYQYFQIKLLLLAVSCDIIWLMDSTVK